MLAPSREALDAVLDYVVHDLGAADVHVDDFKSVVSVAVPAGAVERADTKLDAHVDYAHVEVIRVGEAYSLPAAVAAHVSLVSELVRFPRLRRSDLVAAAVDAAPNATGAWAKCGAKNSAYTNPYVLAERYGFEFPLTDAADGNSMAVAEFQGQYWDPKDLGAFSTACGLPSAISVSKTVGGNVPLLCEGLGQGCVESLLDIEYGQYRRAIPPGLLLGHLLAPRLGEQARRRHAGALVNSVSYGNDEAQQTAPRCVETNHWFGWS
ncbi:C2 domain-containing protein [Aureococcus anophagefferens]|nr:C2 domain-containing protein [Aureococcus anophagefferens]